MKKAISIFSGIDILGLGFSRDYDIVLAVEREKDACKTIEANKLFHPNTKVLCSDVESVDRNYLKTFKGKIDLIFGGPPCQPYSNAKNQFDPKDKRINCLFEFTNWVEIIEPNIFIMENTDALTQKNKKYILDEFVEKTTKLGYKVQFNVLNAHDFGSVQKRKRLIVVGTKKSLNVEYQFPTPIKECEKRYFKDIIVPSEDTGECLQYSTERAFILSQIPPGGNWKNLKNNPELLLKAMGANATKVEGGMTGAYRKASLEEGYCCPTITTNPCQRNTIICHPLENRPLSVKEYMRAQGIPPNYQIFGSTSNKYKFIGNAVPLELAEAISKSTLICRKKECSANEYISSKYIVSTEKDIVKKEISPQNERYALDGDIQLSFII